MGSSVPRHAARGGFHLQSWRLRARVLETGLAALAVVGFVAYASPAYGGSNTVSAVSTCQSGPGSGWTINWTIQNSQNLSETGTVTAVTGGLSTLSTSTFTIAAGQPSSSTTIVQKLPASASGAVTLNFTGTWSDGSTTANSGTYSLSANPSCGPVVQQKQTIGGHIYLCNNGNPTTTDVPGGTIGATGPETVKPVPDPLAATDVPAGSYVVTATDPPGYTLLPCHGTSGSSLSAVLGATTQTQTVNVPAGGNGVAIFYVAPKSGSVPPQPASISLASSALQRSYSGAGQTLDFHYFVKNTGTRELNSVNVQDAHTGLSSISCPNTSLAPQASETCTAIYVTTQADVDAGRVVATATARGTPTGSATVDSLSTLTVPQQAGPGISVTQTANKSTYATVGEAIHFRFDVTNTGDVTLDDVGVTDELVDTPPPTCTATTLDAGDSTTCHSNYSVTQADLSAGSIVNTGTATGTPVDSDPVTATSNTVTLTSIQRLAGHIFLCLNGPTDIEINDGTLAATGPQNVPAQPNPLHAIDVPSGDYTMTATNPAGFVLENCPAAPGNTTNRITEADIAPDGGSATMTVPVPNGGEGIGEFFVAPAHPSLTLKTTAVQTNYSGAGQTINFNFLVTNTGNIGLDNVNITDTLAGVTALTCPEPVLAIGTAETCTGKYTTTAADVTAQSVISKATAHGTPPRGAVVSSSASSVTVLLLAITVTKTASPSSIVAGSSTPIAYTLTLTNTGKVTTPAPINVADSAPSGTTMVSGSAACASGPPPTCSVAVAAPTVTWTIAPGVKPGQVFTLGFKVTANVSDPTGNLTNTALWDGAGCAAGSCTTDTVTTPVTGSASSSSHGAGTGAAGSGTLAFTGALLAQQWMVALVAILLGGGLLVASHRRRSPKHASGSRWGLLELLVSPRSHRDPSGDRKD